MVPAFSLFRINTNMIIVEDGTGVQNANTYVALDTADEYFLTRNITVWSDADEASRNAAMVRATDYIDAKYVFYSVPKTNTQGLQNPRLQDEGLSEYLVKASLELSLIALQSDLFIVDNDSNLTSEKKSGDGIGSIELEWSGTKADKLDIITDILKPIAKLRGGSVSTLRLVK